ncbi:MAG: hypothetical protein OSB26_07375 [Woeseiaceae bacterium]|jgi:hypothetical protein|nr:hypothetical protein [Woeseiaceae bacterium]|tara:strand:+ start:41 stop:367 length:327 start_codon:yes stop_codon:yes gene_type:complete
MNMRSITHMLLFCIVLCLALPAAALQVGPDAPVRLSVEADVGMTPSQETFQGGGVTLSQAVQQVRRQYNGQIVSAVTQMSGNRETHIIKVLTQDGKVKTVRVAGRQRG